MLDLLKEAIFRDRLEEDPLLRRAWIFREGERALIRYDLNVNEDFGVPLEEANRDLRILVNAVRDATAGKERPYLMIWIYDRDPTVPYTDTLAEISLEVKNDKLSFLAELPLELPWSRTIRSFNRFLKVLGIRSSVKKGRIEDFLANLIETSIMEGCVWRKIRKVEFWRRKGKFIVVVNFEMNSCEYSIASHLMEFIKDVRSPYEIFCKVLAWSAWLDHLYKQYTHLLK